MQKNSKTKPSNQEYFTLRGFVSAHTINLPAKFSWLSLSSLTAKTHKPLTITLPANKKMSGLLSYLPPSVRQPHLYITIINLSKAGLIIPFTFNKRQSQLSIKKFLILATSSN
ncbi:hypothetical protein O3W44_01070 [Pantoea sp. LMR881]|uniref:hypothetical protein n=1 Tax=Pantoea sp. LMR881 TaxID=3014336 RepID=UPI0022AE6D55|nr:hypothetical protein [Pantoea sp. LMR881]MCZ4057973.1 hypothetical protein [Pantoea sp. LMR881]